MYFLPVHWKLQYTCNEKIEFTITHGQAIWFPFEQVITPVSSRSAHTKEPLDPQWKDAASKELKGKKDVDSLVWKTPEVCKDLLLKLVTS